MNIGDKLRDKDNKICIIVNMTETSVCVWIGRKTEKGINSTNWFTNENFRKRFKI